MSFGFVSPWHFNSLGLTHSIDLLKAEKKLLADTDGNSGLGAVKSFQPKTKFGLGIA